MEWLLASARSVLKNGVLVENHSVIIFVLLSTTASATRNSSYKIDVALHYLARFVRLSFYSCSFYRLRFA